MDHERVTVFGGTGFLGREIVRVLAARNMSVRVAVRHPENVDFAATDPDFKRIEPVYADVRNEKSVRLAVESSDVVVNAVGLYIEKAAETFQSVHESGARNVARQSAEMRVKQLIHISGIGVDLDSPSRYVRARARGETEVMEAFNAATILRPSVLIGPDDAFFTTLARMARYSPVIPLFGKGDMKLQPVYVRDVAKAVLRVLEDSASDSKLYELGGPQIHTYRSLVEMMLRQTERKRLLVPVPMFAWDLLAGMATLLPNPPITRDQVAVLKHDNVVGDRTPGFGKLNMTPTALADILPSYRWQ